MATEAMVMHSCTGMKTTLCVWIANTWPMPNPSSFLLLLLLPLHLTLLLPAAAGAAAGMHTTAVAAGDTAGRNSQCKCC